MPDFDHLEVCDSVHSLVRQLDYTALPLADRLVLWSVAIDLRQKAAGETDDEDEDEDEPEEDR